MMVTFSKLPVVALAAMLSATSAVYAAQTDLSEGPKQNPTILANAAQQPAYNALLAQRLYPKTTIASKLTEAALQLLVINIAFGIIAGSQPNYSKMLMFNLGALTWYGSGLVDGQRMGMNKIYRQLTRKFGKDWWSWGLKKAKPVATVPAKNEAGA